MNPSQPIDWDALRGRLARAEASQDRDDARQDAVLAERARSLAKAQHVEEDPLGYIEVVEFQLAYERHAIESRCISEAWAMRELVKLPGAPSFVVGIIHARGRFVTVIDPKDFFQLPSHGLPDFNRVLILSANGAEFGLLVDAVVGARRIGRSSIQPALHTIEGMRKDYLLGIAPGPIAVLDAEAILQDPRLAGDDS